MVTRTDADRARRIEQILEAAGAEFAGRGPYGARVDAIARAAGINKRLLYHYVGDKEALFEAVVERCLTRLAAAESNLEDVDPETWQVLVQAVASGRPPDFSGVIAALGDRAGAAGLRARVADALLVQTLAPLADTLPPSTTPPEAVGSSGQKPRIKMRPEVRTR